MAKGQPAAFYLITGFLGSGKTTVLNGILRSLAGRRVGVIVNEWGKIGVDGALLADPSGLGVVELGGGQLFCACISGSFIQAAAALATRDLDYLLAETSGLAKPSNLLAIVGAVESRSMLKYHGMIGVVDASRFLTLRQVVAAVDEQVVYSDRLVLTKTDVAAPETVAAVRAALANLNPDAAIVSVGREGPHAAILATGGVHADGVHSGARYQGWGAAGRPAASAVKPRAPVARAGLECFLRSLAPDSFRIKGFVRLAVDDGADDRAYVDCVGDDIVITSPPPLGARWSEIGLAVIWRGAAPSGAATFVSRLQAAWARDVGTPADIE